MKRKILNKTSIKIIISIILMVMAFLIPDNNIKITMFVLSYLVVGYEVIIDAFKHLITGRLLDENFLMTLATLGAFYIDKYEEAVMVMLLFTIGEYLSDLAVDNSKKEITKLLDLRSDRTTLSKNNKEVKVETKYVKVGDIFIVKPGEKVPLDGIIIEGESSFDTSDLTGEIVPKTFREDDTILSGYINKNKVVKVKATSTYKTSTAAKLLALIENSEEGKTKTEKFITRFAKVYTPIVVILAALIVLIPTLLGYEYSYFLNKSLTFLVISCPCALVISVPLSFFCGIGRASKEGIIIKGSEDLEKLSRVDTFVFDKTGTITEGVFEVIEINGLAIKEDKLLEIAVKLEKNSTHPIATSIIKYYGKEIDSKDVSLYEEISGFGVTGKVKNKKYFIGNEKLMIDNNISIPNIENMGTIIYVSDDKKLLGYFIISDRIKEESEEIVTLLKSEKIKNILLVSGDEEKNVSYVSKRLGMDNYYASVLPDKKAKIIKDLQKNYNVSFVGDGINDALVIKQANLGIAMGSVGSDATVEAADIILMHDNLKKIPLSIRLSRKTMTIVKQNIAFSIFVKVLFLVLGLFNLTTIAFAVFSDVGVTLLVILNSLRILKVKL